MTTVWFRRVEADHAPSYGEAVFSTRERAVASLPQVKTWVAYGDRSWAEFSPRPLLDIWVITEMTLDPEEKK